MKAGLGLSLLLLSAVVAGAEEPPPVPPPIGVTRAPAGGGERIDAVFPGPVVAIVTPEVRPGAREVWALVRPEKEPDGPRTLYRLDPEAKRLDVLAKDLPGGFKTLTTADLDGDGKPELLAGGLGELFSLGPVASLGPPQRLLAHPGFDLRSLHPERIRVPAAGDLPFAAAEAGMLRLYGVSGGKIEPAGRFELPVQAARERSGLRLTSPRVTRLAGADGHPLFAVGPEANGSRRLRTVLLDPALDGAGTGTTLEAWSLLPAAETVEESWYAVVDGKPLLFVMTQSSGQLGIFEGKKLRVFSLVADRTRLGRGPMLAFDTDTRRWHDTDLRLTDTDGDGRLDLVILQPKGLDGSELKLEAFPGIGGGRFVIKTRRSSLDPTPVLWLYGEDLNHDGRPDLAAVGKDDLALYAGSAASGRVIETKPYARFPLPSLRPPGAKEVTVSVGAGPEGDGQVEVSGPPERPEMTAVDLDGDGRLEILLLVPDVDGRGVLRWVRWAS